MGYIDIRSPALWYKGSVFYSHYSECSLDDYENFSFEGDPWLYDRITKGFCFHKPSMDNLQSARQDYALPMSGNSGHRGPILNALVGGQPRSSHKFLAFDLRFHGDEQNQIWMAQALIDAGFHGIGFYNTFIHVDMSRPRFWFGSRLARDKWKDFAIANIKPVTNEERIKEIWKTL